MSRRAVTIEKSKQQGVEISLSNNGRQCIVLTAQSMEDLDTIHAAIGLYLEHGVPVTMDIVGYPPMRLEDLEPEAL